VLVVERKSTGRWDDIQGGVAGVEVVEAIVTKYCSIVRRVHQVGG
jgi:hypothetical protein